MNLPYHRTPLDVNGELIPAIALLADEAVWLPWRETPRPNGKTSKPPVVPATGRGNGWQNPGAAVTYTEALSYADAHQLAGVGIVMGPRVQEIGIVGIDLDDCVSADHQISPWARSILRASGTIETYLERSPSGRGFRVLARGSGTGTGNGCEVYDATTPRFLTVTGNRQPTWPLDIVAADATIAAALNHVASKPQVVEKATQGGDAARSAQIVAPLADVDVALVWSALDAVLCEELSYTEWLNVGAGLHHQFGGSDEGREAWDEWSAKDSGRYDPDALLDKWKSFGRHKGAPVTIRALLGLASARGWKQPRRDATADFGDVSGAEAEWPEPGKLTAAAGLPPAGKWVVGTLPPLLEHFAIDLADRIGADRGAVLGMMVPVVGAMIPGAVSFAPRGDNGWTVPATFFAALVGPPGSLKSPIISALTAPLEKFEAEEKRKYKAAEIRHKREVERIRRERSDEVPPNAPKRRRRTTASATVEGHAKLVERTGESIITLADELATFFGSFDKYTGAGSTGGTDRGYWLSAYDAKPYRSDRADESKCIDVSSVRSSVIGGIQPRVLGAVLASLASDGLAARFLYVPAGAPRMSLDLAADQSRAALYTLACAIILDAAQADLGAPVMLVADDEAKRISFEAEKFGLAYQGELPEDDPLRDIAAKCRGFVARIAAALHVVEWALQEAGEVQLGLQPAPEPLPLTVSGATAAKALAIWKEFYWPNARRVYAGALKAATDRDVDDLAAFLRALPIDKRSFTASDVAHSANKFRGKDNAALRAASTTLESLHWLKRGERNGGTVWMVNPKLRRAE